MFFVCAACFIYFVHLLFLPVSCITRVCIVLLGTLSTFAPSECRKAATTTRSVVRVYVCMRLYCMSLSTPLSHMCRDAALGNFVNFCVTKMPQLTRHHPRVSLTRFIWSMGARVCLHDNALFVSRDSYFHRARAVTQHSKTASTFVSSSRRNARTTTRELLPWASCCVNGCMRMLA